MWVKAVPKDGTIDPDKVIDARHGIEAPNLTGGISKMSQQQHTPVFIGEVRAMGKLRCVENAPACACATPGRTSGCSKDPGSRLVTSNCGKLQQGHTKKCAEQGQHTIPIVT